MAKALPLFHRVGSCIVEAFCFVVDPWINACQAARQIAHGPVSSRLVPSHTKSWMQHAGAANMLGHHQVAAEQQGWRVVFGGICDIALKEMTRHLVELACAQFIGLLALVGVSPSNVVHVDDVAYFLSAFSPVAWQNQ